MFVLLSGLLVLLLAFLAGYKIRKPGLLGGLTAILLVAFLGPVGCVFERLVYGSPPWDVAAGALFELIAPPLMWVIALLPATFAFAIGRYCSPDNKRPSDIVKIDLR